MGTRGKQDYANFLAQVQEGIKYKYENKDLNIKENSTTPTNQDCSEFYSHGFNKEVNLANSQTGAITKSGTTITLGDLSIGYEEITRVLKCESGSLVQLGGDTTKRIITDKQDGMEIYAYAPIEANPYGLKMFKKYSGEISEQHNGLKKCEDDNNGYPNIDSEANICSKDGKNGVYLDIDGYDDYLKYSGLNLGSDFVIEMNVRVPNDSSKHYLIDSGSNFRLYTEDGKLYINVGGNEYNISGVNKGNFNKIFVIRKSNKFYISIGNYNLSNCTGINSTNTINNLIIGAWQVGTSYIKQINDVIDYIKIYK